MAAYRTISADEYGGFFSYARFQPALAVIENRNPYPRVVAVVQSKKKIIIVVPCYNEEKRIRIDLFKQAQRSLYFVFVDDGSTDATVTVLQTMPSSRASILQLKKNHGKAEAIRQGMLYCKEKSLLAHAAWVGYFDADLAAPLGAIGEMLAYDEVFHLNSDVITGCRLKRLGSAIHRSGMRHFLGRLFATVSSMLLTIPVYDSQCGAKLFRPRIVDAVFSEPFLSTWIFDLEVLLRCRKYTVTEFPLFAWNDVSGSKIRFFRDSFRMIRDLLAIRKKYRS